MRTIKTREDGADTWQAWKNNRNVDGVLDGIAQSVQRLATGWTVRGSNPVGGGRGFPNPSTPALGSSQPRIQWVPGLFRGKAPEAWRRG
jgi:hypothetical protein